MTIIIFRDGVMAADTALWDGDRIYTHINKIARLTDGSLVAVCGDPVNNRALAEHLEMGGSAHDFTPPNDDDFGAIIAEPGGGVTFMQSNGAVSHSRSGWYADGMASEMATGALAAGASAEEAVRICIANHAWAGGYVTSMQIGMPEEPEVALDDMLAAIDH